MIDKTAYNELSRIYSVSLKKALGVPKNCVVNKVLLYTNTWTFENLFYYKIILVAK